MRKIVQIATAANHGGFALHALDNEGAVWVNESPFFNTSPWVRIQDLPQDASALPPSNPDPSPDPVDPSVVFDLRSITLAEPAPIRVFEFERPITRLVVECQLPVEWIGQEREVFLIGLGEIGVQIFARTKNRWVCAGARSAEALQSMAAFSGFLIETQESGWSSVKLFPFVKEGLVACNIDRYFLDLSNVRSIQLGENRKTPRGDKKTTRPAGVVFNSIVGFSE